MGPDQIHHILDYVIPQGGRFFPQLVGVMMRPGTGANSGFATARRIKLARRTVSPEALSRTLANRLVLLDHSTFRRFNEPDQHVHVLTAIRLRLQFFQGLCGVTLGGKQNLISLLNLSNSLLFKPAPVVFAL